MVVVTSEMISGKEMTMNELIKNIHRIYDDFHASCVPLYKYTRNPVWNGYNQKKFSKEQILVHLKKYPKSNVAIALNFSTLLILDIDGPIGEKILLQLTGGKPINTFTVKTGDGCHYYFRVPKGSKYRKRIGIRKEIDILIGKCLVMAPGSMHDDGAQYQVINDIAIAEIPGWLIGLLEKPQSKIDIEVDKTITTRFDDCVVKEDIDEGERDSKLFDVALKQKCGGLSRSNIFEELKQINRDHCNPPLELEEIWNIVNGVFDGGSQVSIVYGDVLLKSEILKQLRSAFQPKQFPLAVTLYISMKNHFLTKGPDPVWNYRDYFGKIMDRSSSLSDFTPF